MPYEEDYKMWLEKMLIESNPDWVCDGMYDKEITRNWCVDYCGEDDEYITPRCLHMYYHHIARTDRKTEPSCDTCKFKDTTEWCKRQEVCRAYQPKDEPQTCEDCKHNGEKHAYDYACDKCTDMDKFQHEDEPQTEREDE